MAIYCPWEFLSWNDGTKCPRPGKNARVQTMTITKKTPVELSNLKNFCFYLKVLFGREQCTICVNVTHSFLKQYNEIIHSKYAKNFTDELFLTKDTQFSTIFVF